MQARQNYTVIGVFENEDDADRAVADLYKIGIREDQIGVARRNVEIATDETVEEGTEAAPGAVTGAVTGLGLGTLAGLGVISGILPVVGPAIAGGTLGVILSNAAAGAGIAGLIGALVGAGVPEHEARYYHNEFAAGRTILTVNTIELSREAGDILRRNGAYDLSSRSTPIGEADHVQEAPADRGDVRVEAERDAAREGSGEHEDLV